MVCSSCGTQNRKGATYCYRCYAKLEKKSKRKDKTIDYENISNHKSQMPNYDNDHIEEQPTQEIVGHIEQTVDTSPVNVTTDNTSDLYNITETNEDSSVTSENIEEIEKTPPEDVHSFDTHPTPDNNPLKVEDKPYVSTSAAPVPEVTIPEVAAPKLSFTSDDHTSERTKPVYVVKTGSFDDDDEEDAKDESINQSIREAELIAPKPEILSSEKYTDNDIENGTTPLSSATSEINSIEESKPDVKSDNEVKITEEISDAPQISSEEALETNKRTELSHTEESNENLQAEEQEQSAPDESNKKDPVSSVPASDSAVFTAEESLDSSSIKTDHQQNKAADVNMEQVSGFESPAKTNDSSGSPDWDRQAQPSEADKQFSSPIKNPDEKTQTEEYDEYDDYDDYDDDFEEPDKSNETDRSDEMADSSDDDSDPENDDESIKKKKSGAKKEQTRKEPEHKKETKKTNGKKKTNIPSSADPEIDNDQSQTQSQQKKPKRDDGYDGYYDDVLPEDYGNDYVFEGLDKEMLKKVALIAGGGLLVIIVMIVVMFYFN